MGKLATGRCISRLGCSLRLRLIALRDHGRQRDCGWEKTTLGEIAFAVGTYKPHTHLFGHPLLRIALEKEGRPCGTVVMFVFGQLA
jgi:hypothetical protein